MEVCRGLWRCIGAMKVWGAVEVCIGLWRCVGGCGGVYWAVKVSRRLCRGARWL